MTGIPFLWALFAGGLALNAGLIASARRVAIASGFVARPNPIVRSHRVPVPYLGGAAIALGYAAMLLLASRIAAARLAPGAVERLGAVLALAVFGTIDDRRPFGPAAKLLVQSAVCVAYLALVDRAASPLSFAIHVVVLLTLVNAYNLIDVMDGLLCLLSAAAILGLLAVAPRAAGLEIELLLGLAAIVAMFLFNRPPARIYSGDAGSLALGFLIGAWCLTAAQDTSPRQAIALAGVVGVPLLELALIVPARLLQGRNPLRGSPDHFALRLQDRLGWGPWRVLGRTLFVAALLAAAPLLEARLGITALAGYVVGVLITATMLWRMLWLLPPRPRG